MWKANGAADLPLADRAHGWDVRAAEDRVRRFAGAPDVDWAIYRKAFFAYDDENADKFSGYKLPFCDVMDGKLVAVPRAIFAVAAVLMGARGGVDLPEAVKADIKRRVAAYYKRIDENLSPPWEANRTFVREGRILSERNRRLIEDAIQQSQEAIDALRRLLEETDPEARQARSALLTVRSLAETEDGGLRVGGYAIVFGGRDLYGTFFTPETDTWPDALPTPPVLYDHGFDPAIGPTALGHVVARRKDAIGEWVEAELSRHSEYLEAIRELIQCGALGWSTGTAAHLADVAGNGEIRRWPVVEVSLTPTPAEPRTLPAEIVRAIAPEVLAVEAAGAGNSDAASEIYAAKYDEGETTMEEKEIMEQPEGERAEEAEHVESSPPVAAEVRSAEPEVPNTKMGLFAVKRVSVLGTGVSDQARELVHFLRSGQMPASTRAAVQWAEGSGATGGYLVPDDLYNEIVAKLSEQSIARAMGATVYNTSRDVVKVPVFQPLANLSVTAEGGAYAETEVTPFAEVSIPVYKFTRLVKVSEEMLEDAAFNVERIVMDAIAAAMAETENAYFIAGTGSGQPQGALTGAELGVTAASTSALTAAEIVELYYSLSSKYRNDGSVCWTMADSTERAIRKLQASATAGEFLFQVTPAGTLGGDLMGKRLWNSAFVPEIAASAKVALFGAWKYYVIAQRSGLVIQRNPYLYAGTGYVGFFAKFRVGGAVTIAEAFKYLQMAAS